MNEKKKVPEWGVWALLIISVMLFALYKAGLLLIVLSAMIGLLIQRMWAETLIWVPDLKMLQEHKKFMKVKRAILWICEEKRLLWSSWALSLLSYAVLVGVIVFGGYTLIMDFVSNALEIKYKVIATVEKTLEWLPLAMQKESLMWFENIKSQGLKWFGENVWGVAKVGQGLMGGLTMTGLGFVLAAMIGWRICGSQSRRFIDTEIQRQEKRFLDEFIIEHVLHLFLIFAKMIKAQLKVSLVNTLLAAVYLLVVLPIAGAKVPYAWALVGLVLVLGLLPVIGGVLANTLILLSSLSVSLNVAIASGVFLIICNQIEYYTNAKFMSKGLSVTLLELLLALLIFQNLLGIIGAILAPVLFVFYKYEGQQLGWISVKEEASGKKSP